MNNPFQSETQSLLWIDDKIKSQINGYSLRLEFADSFTGILVACKDSFRRDFKFRVVFMRKKHEIYVGSSETDALMYKSSEVDRVIIVSSDLSNIPQVINGVFKGYEILKIRKTKREENLSNGEVETLKNVIKGVQDIERKVSM